MLGLLKKITELQIRNARYANPLTLLPGNVPIFEYLDQLIQDRQVFTVAYCDIDNFKPYNDVYGYGEGDKVIKLIAEILRSNVHPSIDFIGHVGGDDFIVVFSGDNWMERCRSILHDFEHQIPDLYSDEDILRGGILSHSREGDERFFPIMTLSIGAVIPNTIDHTRRRSQHGQSGEASCQSHQRQQLVHRAQGQFLTLRSNLRQLPLQMFFSISC